MKVVTLSSKDDFGGAAKVAYRLYKSLSERGADNLFLVNNKRSSNSDVVRASTYYSKRNILYPYVEKYLLKYNERKRQNKWKYYHDKLDVVMMDQDISLLKDALNNLNFDLLHLHWVGDSFVNFTEFKNIQKPVVWTLHDCFPFTGICTHFEDCYKFTEHCGACFQLNSKGEKDLSFKVFEQKLTRYKNINFHIVCPSNWLADCARKSKLLGHFPIEVIPNGIDTSFFCPASKEEAKEALGIPQEKKVILLGSISIDRDRRKGGKLLLEALSIFKENNREEVEILVFGTSNMPYDLGYRTTCLGYIDDDKYMRTAYNAADVCVVPSMYENLSTVIMESLSCGTPVVAFDTGGNSDMIDHKQNGYLAKKYEVEELAKGLQYCLYENESNRLGEAGRQKVLDNFRIEDVSDRYFQLYQRVLK